MTARTLLELGLILFSNELTSSPSSIDVLYEIRQKRPDLFDKMEIYVDGGVKSGADVVSGPPWLRDEPLLMSPFPLQVKALALGAKGVGLGRSFLYANACYGQEGVEKIYQSESVIIQWHLETDN
jgi:L-lactate dehydrogenase (cytochrome)